MGRRRRTLRKASPRSQSAELTCELFCLDHQFQSVYAFTCTIVSLYATHTPITITLPLFPANICRMDCIFFRVIFITQVELHNDSPIALDLPVVGLWVLPNRFRTAYSSPKSCYIRGWTEYESCSRVKNRDRCFGSRDQGFWQGKIQGVDRNSMQRNFPVIVIVWTGRNHSCELEPICVVG